MKTFPRVTLHSDYYYRQFVTKTWTVGYAFAISIWVLVYILPFMTTYSSGGKLYKDSYSISRVLEQNEIFL